MKHIVTLAAALAMMTMAVPVTAEEDVREMNREYILDLVGDDYDPEALVQAPSGERVEAEEALDIVLDRLDRFGADLAALDDAEKNPLTDTPTAGDLWIIELAGGTCNQGGGRAGGHYNSASPSPLSQTLVTPWDTTLTWPFIGDGTTVGSDGGMIIDMPTDGIYRFTDQVDYQGFSDFWCISFSGLAFNMPMVQGVVR